MRDLGVVATRSIALRRQCTAFTLRDVRPICLFQSEQRGATATATARVRGRAAATATAIIRGRAAITAA